MGTSGSGARALGAVVVVVAALMTGCGSSGGHPASAPTTPAGATTTTTAERSGSPLPNGKSTTTASAPLSASSRAELSDLKEQLDAAGTSLGAAANALAQSDPNQTKSSEGTLP